MSATLAPQGMIPVYHQTGFDREDQPYTIGAAYGTAIYKGSPVLLNTDGTLNIATTTNDFLGIFMGVQWIDAQGKPTYSNYWPGAQTGATQIQAWVITDVNTVFEIQADGAVAATGVGAQTDFSASIGAGTTATGLSTATCAATPEAGAAQGQLRIIGVSPRLDNAWGDAYTWLRVQIAQSQYVANKVGI